MSINLAEVRSSVDAALAELEQHREIRRRLVRLADHCASVAQSDPAASVTHEDMATKLHEILGAVRR